MKTRVVLIAAGLVFFILFTTRPAAAVKTELKVTPENLKDVEGLSVAAERRDDGRVRFTIRRDPSKACWQRRTGDLHVAVDAGEVVDCSVHGRKTPGGVIEYRFTVSPEALARSEFVLREVQGSEADEIQVIGGGEFYAIRLVDFRPS